MEFDFTIFSSFLVSSPLIHLENRERFEAFHCDKIITLVCHSASSTFTHPSRIWLDYFNAKITLHILIKTADAVTTCFRRCSTGYQQFTQQNWACNDFIHGKYHIVQDGRSKWWFTMKESSQSFSIFFLSSKVPYMYKLSPPATLSL